MWLSSRKLDSESCSLVFCILSTLAKKFRVTKNVTCITKYRSFLKRWQWFDRLTWKQYSPIQSILKSAFITKTFSINLPKDIFMIWKNLKFDWILASQIVRQSNSSKLKSNAQAVRNNFYRVGLLFPDKLFASLFEFCSLQKNFYWST